jgi:hypothetical protein
MAAGFFGRLIAVVQRFRENYGDWAREATYRRGMALAGPKAIPYKQYRKICDRLADRWQVGSGLWNPIRDKSAPPNTIIVHEFAFRQEVGIAAIHRVLRERGITLVVELDELGMGFSLDVDQVLRPNQILDCYWTSESADWLIHRSDQDSLAFAGLWLVRHIQRVWPTWDQHCWP